MKICYITHDLNPSGGWGRLSEDLIHGVEKAGHQVIVLKQSRDESGGITAIKSRTWPLMTFWSARKYLRDCDLVHAIDGYPFAVFGTLANMGLNKKLVITLVGTYSVAPLYHRTQSWLLKWAYKSADHLTSISNFTKQEVLKKISLKNIEVINPGIDLEKFYRPKVEAREKFILSVGALKFRKGYHNSIQAFALAKKQIPQLRYKIVGSQSDRNYFSDLKKMALKLKVDKDIEFLAGLSDDELASLYQTAQLFILTSINHNHHFEGFGIVFLEAAAAGLPCIGTRGSGIEDALQDGYNGFLVDQNDPENTATKIVEMLIVPEQYQNFSANSIEWAKQHSMKASIAKYLEVYRKVLEEINDK